MLPAQEFAQERKCGIPLGEAAVKVGSFHEFQRWIQSLKPAAGKG